MNTVHGVAVTIAGTGILIVGSSGSGKTELALDLIDHCLIRNIEAHLVADDRVTLRRDSEYWFASAPDNLKGLVEVRGSGIHKIDFLPQTALHLGVRLVPETESVRMPELQPVEICPGVFLPCLTLPQRNFAAARAVLAHLGLYAGVKSQISDQ
jgi:serine kinase of HPr protein (carbohydrate metabolism regulator)